MNLTGGDVAVEEGRKCKVCTLSRAGREVGRSASHGAPIIPLKAKLLAHGKLW